MYSPFLRSITHTIISELVLAIAVFAATCDAVAVVRRTVVRVGLRIVAAVFVSRLALPSVCLRTCLGRCDHGFVDTWQQWFFLCRQTLVC